MQNKPGRPQVGERKGRRFYPNTTTPASEHGAGHYAGLHPEDQPHVTTADMQTQLTRTQAGREYNTNYPVSDDEQVYKTGQPTSVRRYQRIQTPDGYAEQRGNQQMRVHYVDEPPPIQRASKGGTANQSLLPPARKPEAPLYTRQRRGYFKRFHWSVLVGVCLMVMLVGWILLSAFGTWFVNWRNYTDYSYPRTFQIDAVVGHHDGPENPSHFLAINLNRHVVIIEFPGGDVSHAISYIGPVLLGNGED